MRAVVCTEASAQSAMTQANKQALNHSMEQVIKQSVREFSVGVTIQHKINTRKQIAHAARSLHRIACKCRCPGEKQFREHTIIWFIIIRQARFPTQISCQRARPSESCSAAFTKLAPLNPEQIQLPTREVSSPNRRQHIVWKIVVAIIAWGTTTHPSDSVHERCAFAGLASSPPGR